MDPLMGATAATVTGLSLAHRELTPNGPNLLLQHHSQSHWLEDPLMQACTASVAVLSQESQQARLHAPLLIPRPHLRFLWLKEEEEEEPLM